MSEQNNQAHDVSAIAKAAWDEAWKLAFGDGLSAGHPLGRSHLDCDTEWADSEVVARIAKLAAPAPSATPAADQGIEFWKRMVSSLAGIIQDAAPIVGKEPGEESAEEIGRLLKQLASASPAALTAPNTKAMVDRFLGWKLPRDFSPDCGVSFTPVRHGDLVSWPIGTNLLSADQARQMFEYVLAIPAPAPAAHPDWQGVRLSDAEWIELFEAALWHSLPMFQRKAAAILSRASSSRAEVERDAARYRWWREWLFKNHGDSSGMELSGTITATELDARIDAQLAAAEAPKEGN